MDGTGNKFRWRWRDKTEIGKTATDLVPLLVVVILGPVAAPPAYGDQIEMYLI